MRTRCHYSEMNLLRKRLCLSQVKTLVKENYMLSRECDDVYAGSFRRALSLAALTCFQRTLLQGYIPNGQKTAPPKLMTELIKTIIPPKGVKTAKPSKYDAPEDEGMKYGMSMIMKIQNGFRYRVFGVEGNGIDTRVHPEDKTV